jgi:hypothetical protein
MTYQKLLTQAAIRFTPVLESIGTTCDIWLRILGSSLMVDRSENIRIRSAHLYLKAHAALGRSICVLICG